MKVSFSVLGLPPKKDGANSMWRKGTELPRLRDLRFVALQAMQGIALPTGPVTLVIRVYASPATGDLDNFITGICDGLMAVHPNAPLEASGWGDLPAEARPDRPIAFRDDSSVSKIEAERLPPGPKGVRYEVDLEWTESPIPSSHATEVPTLGLGSGAEIGK